MICLQAAVVLHMLHKQTLLYIIDYRFDFFAHLQVRFKGGSNVNDMHDLYLGRYTSFLPINYSHSLPL